MGTDNLHHRRKAKSARELRRRQAKRESYAKVLIVCEGEKTSANPEGVFVAVTSIPCFEYWLLLHYTYTTRPYTIQQTKSAAEQVISELKQYIPNYQKGTSNIFKQLIDSLEFAKANSARALQEAVRNGTDNPSTRIHELVSFLQTIKQA